MLGDLDLDIALATAIVSTGPPSAYALVWEYGNIRQTKKGPKTVLGVDPETGARVWLTIQAPSGYVRILKPQFRDIIEEEIIKVKFGGKDVKTQLIYAMDRIGRRMTALVKQYVPVDKGDLKASITWLHPQQGQNLKQALAGVRGNR